VIRGNNHVCADLFEGTMNRTEIAGAVIEDDDRRCHD
jgi:hypothetical protein